MSITIGIDPGMTGALASLRGHEFDVWDMKDLMIGGEVSIAAAIDFLAERGMVVLGPDGEPIDVRPALWALGRMAPWDDADDHSWLAHRGITDTLADACLAAAEVEP